MSGKGKMSVTDEWKRGGSEDPMSNVRKLGAGAKQTHTPR